MKNEKIFELDSLSTIAPSAQFPPSDYKGSNWLVDRVKYGQDKFAEAQKMRGEVAQLNAELTSLMAQHIEYRNYLGNLLGQLVQPVYPGFPVPGSTPGFPIPGFPGTATGYPQPGVPQVPGFPQPGVPGIPQGGSSQMPSTPPPAYTPQKPVKAPGYYAIDPGAFFGCMFKFTYVWLTNGDQFWYFPIYTGPNSGAGYRWNGVTWNYFALDLRLIDAVTC